MRLLAALSALALTACAGGDPCDTQGATRCDGAEVQACNDGAWEATDTCAEGTSCMQMDGMANGEAHCM